METINDKAERIEKSALADAYALNARAEIAHLSAVGQLSLACALLTSTSKDERERGKTMVRRWKAGNTF